MRDIALKCKVALTSFVGWDVFSRTQLLPEFIVDDTRLQMTFAYCDAWAFSSESPPCPFVISHMNQTLQLFLQGETDSLMSLLIINSSVYVYQARKRNPCSQNNFSTVTNLLLNLILYVTFCDINF